MMIFKLHNDFNFVLGDIDNNNYTSSIAPNYKSYRIDLLPIVLKIDSDNSVHVELLDGDIIYLDLYKDKYCILSKICRNDVIFELNERSLVSMPFINQNKKIFEDCTLQINRNEKINSILDIN